MRAAKGRGWAIGLMAALALPALAQRGPAAAPAAAPTVLHAAATGELLGMVTDATGQPQADAVVTVRARGSQDVPLRRVTGPDGVFDLAGLAPGFYEVQVAKGKRVTSGQPVQVRASERALLLLNLPELLQSARFGAPKGQHPGQDFDWALRQATVWKPVLRWRTEQHRAAASPVEGYVALSAGAGSSAFDVPDVATEFRVDAGLWGEPLSVSGDVGTNGQGGGSDTRIQATWRSSNPSNASRFSAAVRELSVPGRSALPGLRVVSLNYANAVNVGDRLRVQYGAMANTVTMTDTVATFDPYVRLQYQLGSQAELEYRAVSAVPPVRFGPNHADMPDPTPQVTLDHNRARLERARHQELKFAATWSADDTLTAAVFDEHFSRAAVNGTFSLSGQPPAATAIDSSLLPDLLNNMFVANGGNYGGWGYRISDQHQLSARWVADVSWDEGEALAPLTTHFSGDLAAALAPVRVGAITAKITGVLPVTNTRLICSYRALTRPTATVVDPYNDGAGQSEAYANLYLRQPLPGFIAGATGRLAALLEIHNLLAQGYIPMMGSDGRTLYLVQSARSLRGGFTFNF